MYEPIRTKSVHTTTGAPADFPHRSREEELDIQLAGHLSALLAVTDEIRGLAPGVDLDAAAERIVAQVVRLRGGGTAVRAGGVPAAAAPGPSGAPGTDRDPGVRLAMLHRRAHALAGRALVVAASRADTAVAILAAERMDVHAVGGAAARVAASL